MDPEIAASVCVCAMFVKIKQTTDIGVRQRSFPYSISFPNMTFLCAKSNPNNDPIKSFILHSYWSYW